MAKKVKWKLLKKQNNIVYNIERREKTGKLYTKEIGGVLWIIERLQKIQKKLKGKKVK